MVPRRSSMAAWPWRDVNSDRPSPRLSSSNLSKRRRMSAPPKISAESSSRCTSSLGQVCSRSIPKPRAPSGAPPIRSGMRTLARVPKRSMFSRSTAASAGSSARREIRTRCPFRSCWDSQGNRAASRTDGSGSIPGPATYTYVSLRSSLPSMSSASSARSTASASARRPRPLSISASSVPMSERARVWVTSERSVSKRRRSASACSARRRRPPWMRRPTTSAACSNTTAIPARIGLR